jgi:arabinose-5-phosphate isomerase
MKRNLEPTARKEDAALQSVMPVRADADRDAALRVLTLEADGIRALAGSLDGNFSRAVEILARVGQPGRGARVVVSGMGKSGHIARKIAATLASTGTPAQFVHPAEASHGDLGMITAMDAVLCLSNSGETPELGDLVAHAKRFDVPLIGIVGRAGSTLAQAANVALVLPPMPEACPLGLAPMTSTTVMLALGDALAAALLERKGFTPEQFQVLHPGGKLGKALIKVGDIMHVGDDVPLLRLGAAMREAILTMSAKGFGCVGIVDGADKLVGIITDGDLRRHIDDDILARTVDEVMTRMPKTIRPQALAAEALGQMNANKITALFVTEDGRLKGIVRVHDILRAGVA